MADADQLRYAQEFAAQEDIVISAAATEAGAAPQKPSNAAVKGAKVKAGNKSKPAAAAKGAGPPGSSNVKPKAQAKPTDATVSTTKGIRRAAAA